MTSNNIFPRRLTKIDDLVLEDHFYLDVSDDCYYLGEYTARAGYEFSATNNLVLNFKKSVDRKGSPEWPHKNRAIDRAAAAFKAALNDDGLTPWTFVPVPPSRAKGDPLYDDRMPRMLQAIRPMPPLDIRELIVQETSTVADHATDERRTPQEIQAGYSINESVSDPQPRAIAIVDDVLTTGAHFKAAQAALVDRFDSVRVIGLFIARRAPGTVDIDW
jgi:hypothetical protein